jgi:hypothetical protein
MILKRLDRHRNHAIMAQDAANCARGQLGDQDMRLRSHPIQHSLLVLVMFEAFGLISVANADPMAATKIRTIAIRPQSTEDHGDPLASSTNAMVHSPTILNVRPQSAEQNSDASGRPLSFTQDPGHATPGADPHAVHSITIRPDHDAYPAYAPLALPGPTGDLDRQFNHAIRDPSQFTPE